MSLDDALSSMIPSSGYLKNTKAWIEKTAFAAAVIGVIGMPW